MPRKDRRFTGQDLRRIYCRNLTPTQRRFFDITVCDWDDYSPVEQVLKIIEALEETGLLDEALKWVPNGEYIQKAIDVIKLILNQGDIGQITWVQVLDWIEADQVKQNWEEILGNINGAIDYYKDEKQPAIVELLKRLL